MHTCIYVYICTYIYVYYKYMYVMGPVHVNLHPHRRKAIGNYIFKHIGDRQQAHSLSRADPNCISACIDELCSTVR